MRTERILLPDLGQQLFTYWHIEDDSSLLWESSDGLALAALLCNAAAKRDASWYQYKSALVAAACTWYGADRGRWWVDTHSFAFVTGWQWFDRVNTWWCRQFGWPLYGEAMTVYFLETTIPYDGDTLQLAFHFRSGDRLPATANIRPRANGRTWRGQHAQANARRIALDWIKLKRIASGDPVGVEE